MQQQQVKAIVEAKLNLAISFVKGLPSFGSSDCSHPLKMITMHDLSGYTPLHYFVAGGMFEEASLLCNIFVNFGISSYVNSYDGQGRTPLYWAVVKGNVQIVKLLLEHGANANISNFEGKSLIISSMENFPVCKSLHERESIRAIIHELLNHGIDTNFGDSESGSSPLHIASAFGEDTIIDYLLAAGANANLLDHEGENALFYAVREQQSTTIRKLIQDVKINYHVKNTDGETVMDLCRVVGDNAMLRLLDSLGCNKTSDARPQREMEIDLCSLSLSAGSRFCISCTEIAY